MHSGGGKQYTAHAQFSISVLQLLQRGVGIVHRQNGDAFETAIAPQISFGEPIVVSTHDGFICVVVADAAPEAGPDVAGE